MRRILDTKIERESEKKKKKQKRAENTDDIYIFFGQQKCRGRSSFSAAAASVSS